MLFYDLFRLDPEYVEIKEGNTLFREGDDGNEMYVLITGKADVIMGGVLIGKCSQGDIVGEMAVVDGSPRYGTVTATTDCKFVVIDKKRFHYLIEETPGFALEVIRIVAKRLKECDLRVVTAASGLTTHS
jgi:CRP-like cAMP-binding protein